MKTCENCSSLNVGSYGSGRFCSAGCARAFSTKSKRQQINEKVSLKLSGIVTQTGLKASQPVTKKCRRCEQEFVVPIGKKKQIYCSIECKGWNNHNQVDWSEVHKRAYATGRNYVAGGTSKWYELETSNGPVKVQGSYEVRTVRILERLKKNGTIKNWSYATDRIAYYEDGKVRTYLIDFKIFDDTGFWYLEVKGYTKSTDFLKWDAVRSNGFKLEVWFDEDIKLRE